MTSKKQLKERIRARMAATGERYLTARRHIVGDRPSAPAVDRGYPLRGGVHPESAAVANVLAFHGVRAGGAPLSEAMVLGVGGGVGAGYILWEFVAHGTARHLVLGFRNGWQNPAGWTEDVLARLGVPAHVHRTSGAKGAAAALGAALAGGRPAIILPDRYHIGYWHLPPHLGGHGGHTLVAYAEEGGRVHVDDRTLAPLTVDRSTLDVARARVVSYKNLLIEPRPPRDLDLPVAALRAAAVAGLAACAAQLTSTSESFALPAWRKWQRLVTDPRHAKGWPKVFADGHGLTGALLSTWEEIEPAGMSGGNLRRLYAEFLLEAAGLLDAPALADVAPAFVAAADAWHEVAEVAFPADVPEFAEIRELTAAVSGGVTAEGDGAADQLAQAGERL